MKNYIIKRYLKYLGIIPNNCVYCLKDLEIEKLKINQDKDLQQNFDFEYICKDCLKKHLNKFNVCIDKISINKNTIIKHIYLGKYNKIKDEIMDIKYFDKQYILKAIIEITIKDIIINIDGNKKSDIIMIYIPTTLQKIIERGNISKYICKKIRYEIGKNNNLKKEEIEEKGKIMIKKICTIAKVEKDIEMKKLNKEERNIKVKEKYCYIKGNFLEKYIKENIRQNDIKIMIVDDVYTTGATMKNILEMIENNIMKNLGNEEKQKIEYIFFSLAKD